MLAGHHDLAQTLWDMADEKLPRCVFLSSLDLGMGKSTVLVAFIEHLLASPDHEDVAVLVCLSRLSEMKDFEAEHQSLQSGTRTIWLNTSGTSSRRHCSILSNEAWTQTRSSKPRG